MNSMIIITVMIVLFFSILPIVLINRGKKKNEKSFLQSLFNLAEKNNCNLSEHDAFNDIAIGIDKETHQLFFIRNTHQHEAEIKVDLTEIKKCRLLDTSRPVPGSDGNQRIIDKLELSLVYHSQNQKEIILDIYHADYDSLTMSGELQLAKKWSEKINEELAALNKA